MTSETDLSQFWCWNKECPDYGKKGQGNIVIKQRYGKDNRALLKCRTCKDYFSETRGTIFFGLDTPQEEVLRTLAMIHDSLKIEVNCGNRRWEHRTPAMTEKFTNHIWTLGELFGFKVPVK